MFWKNGILGSSVGKMVTDNGSNMVKAFQHLAVKGLGLDSDDEEEFSNENSVTTIDDEILSDDEVDEAELFSEGSDEIDIAKEVAEFDGNELLYNDSFSSQRYERLACFAHTLQLVVVKFDEIKPCKDSISTAKRIVAKVNKSVKATEMLKTLCNVKLCGDCPTRWSSTFLLLERLLKVKKHLEDVLKALKWDGLQPRQWKLIENVVELLRPFAEYTDLCGGDTYIYNHFCCDPCVNGIIFALE